MAGPSIEIDVGKDKVVATAAPYRISMGNVEVEEPTTTGAASARIEIPERKRQDAVDSDGSDYAFLANPKKLTAPKEIPVPAVPKDAEDPNSDSDSGRSRHSARSWKSHHSSSGSHRSHHTARSKRSERSEYRPRYSMPDETRSRSRAGGESSSPPIVDSLFSSGLFSRRTHAMSEDDIRREKSYLLQQYQNKNRDQRYSPKRFSMDSSLEDIQNELQFITSKREMENSMSTWKRSFLMCAQGIVQLNTTYDPFNFKVDLSDWAADLHHDVDTEGKYDEVLEELITKWRGKMPMSPEMKLLVMMGTSLAFGIMSKKKEAALLAKRMDADRKMEQRIDAAVEKKFASKMREHHLQQQQQAATDHLRRQPQTAAFRPMPMPPRAKAPTVSTDVRPSSPPQGPSLSHADLMKIMEANIIESSSEDDDTSSLSSESTLTSRDDDDDIVSVSLATPAVADAQSSGPSNLANGSIGNTTVKVTKPRAKTAAKVKVTTQEKEEDDDEDILPSAVVAKKPVAKRAAATAGAPARARGRPRKNPQANATVVTLENF